MGSNKIKNSFENPNKEAPLAALIELLIEKGVITAEDFKAKKDKWKK